MRDYLKLTWMFTSLLWMLFPLGQDLCAQSNPKLDPLIQNVYGRKTISLNGSWSYLLDQLEVGYYNYRRTPDPNGFFKDPMVDNVTVYKEYDFDSAPVMSIPEIGIHGKTVSSFTRERCGSSINFFIKRQTAESIFTWEP